MSGGGWAIRQTAEIRFEEKEKELFRRYLYTQLGREEMMAALLRI
jgi:hypothetical protein